LHSVDPNKEHPNRNTAVKMTYFPPSVWGLIQTMKHEMECAPLREHRERFAPTLKVIATAYCDWLPYICCACEAAGLCGEVVDCHFSVETHDNPPFRRFDKHPVLDENGDAVFDENYWLVKKWGMQLQCSWPCGRVKCPVRGGHDPLDRNCDY
jgi:hypothetical protein